MTTKPRTCVVISYWAARSVKNLYRLLRQMQKIDAGSPFDIVIVSNGGRPNSFVTRGHLESKPLDHRNNFLVVPALSP
jgi:hypothetical protein